MTVASSELLKVGERVLSAAQRRLPHAQAEVFLMASDKRLAEWSEGKPENSVVAQSHGLGLRVISEGRLGFAYGNHWDPEAVESLISQAEAGSRSTAPDTFLEVPPTASADVAPSLDLSDKTLDRTPWDVRAKVLESLESEARRRDPRIVKVLRGTYNETSSDVAVVNSRGIRASYHGTHIDFSVACVAEDQGETQLGYAFQSARHAADLPVSKVIDQAVDHTVSQLGGKRISSGRYDLILDPFVAAEMLELLAHALRGDFVLKGKSFLAGRVGEKVGSTCLNVWDNGRLRRGLGSSPFDAEGMPTQSTPLLKQGRLQGFLYDTYTGRRAKHPSTGNAGRSSYKSVPEPEASNFYLDSGTTSPEKMIASVTSGLYVRHVMGLHTVDTISGDYSLGLAGQRIENGVRTHAVRGVTMAGNLLDLLRSVEAVGSDLTFYGSVGSPTLWIRDVSIGGA